jgi:uncharacterized protein YndB with AHSA1/START domain
MLDDARPSPTTWLREADRSTPVTRSAGELMTTPPNSSDLDLSIERFVALAPETIWAAWTLPEHLTEWFTPAPWQTVEAEVDLRPGGVFRTVMRGPAGEEGGGAGCYLVVEAPHRLVWTSALGEGFRPNDVGDEFAFTAELTLVPSEGGTTYRARVMHATIEGCAQHAEMGFVEGWNAALDQLIAYMSSR